MPGQSYQRQLLSLKVTTPAGTAIAAPQATVWKLGWVYLNKLSVRVPDGHVGLTGLVVLYNGVAIFPFGQPPSYLVTNQETLSQPFEQEEISAPLTIQTYNLDIFDHSHYLRADVTWVTGDVGASTTVGVVPSP